MKKLVKGTRAAKEHMAHLRSLRSPLPALSQSGHQSVTFDLSHKRKPPKVGMR